MSARRSCVLRRMLTSSSTTRIFVIGRNRARGGFILSARHSAADGKAFSRRPGRRAIMRPLILVVLLLAGCVAPAATPGPASSAPMSPAAVLAAEAAIGTPIAQGPGHNHAEPKAHD